jgi:hypothetical protein
VHDEDIGMSLWVSFLERLTRPRLCGRSRRSFGLIGVYMSICVEFVSLNLSNVKSRHQSLQVDIVVFPMIDRFLACKMDLGNKSHLLFCASRIHSIVMQHSTARVGICNSNFVDHYGDLV